MNESKPWKCAGGHVMGLVQRNGSGVRQLWLYREASPTPAMSTSLPSPNAAHLERERQEGVEVMAIIEGYVADVKCSICGRVRTWVPGEEALRKLLENYRSGK